MTMTMTIGTMTFVVLCERTEVYMGGEGVKRVTHAKASEWRVHQAGSWMGG